MPDVKIDVPKVPAPSSNVGKVYGTYVTETEKKAAAANDWLLPKDKAAEATRSTTSSVKSSVTKIAAPATPVLGAAKAASGAISGATGVIGDKASAITGNLSGKAGELTGNLTGKVGDLTGKLQLPQMPNFPGLDKGGIMLGAGPKFISNTVTKFTSIVPPFVPGLVMNVGMIAGAISVVKSMSSINPSQLLSQLTSNIAGDLKDQAGGLLASATDAAGGLGDIKNQVTNLEGAAAGIVDSAKGAVSGLEASVSGVTSNISVPDIKGAVNLPNISVPDIKGNLITSATKPVSDAVSGAASKIIPPVG